MKYKKREKFFNENIVPYYYNVYNYLCRLTNDEELAADLTQETMEKAWRGLDNLKSLDAVKTWIFRIATNQLKLYFRAQTAQKRSHEEIDSINEKGELIIENVSSCELEPLEEIILKGDKKAAMEALKRVQQEYQVIINLYLVEGLTFNEVVVITEKANSTVQYQYKKGVKMLRKEFDRIMEKGEL